jgi:hypothetical protein
MISGIIISLLLFIPFNYSFTDETKDGAVASNFSTAAAKIEKDSWYTIGLVNQQIGYLHSTCYNTEWNGEPAIGFSDLMSMKIKRSSVVLQYTVEEISFMSGEGNFKGFQKISRATGEPTTNIKGIVLEGALVLEKKIQEGESISRRIPLPENYSCFQKEYIAMLSGKPVVGQKRSYRAFDEDKEVFYLNEIEIIDQVRLEQDKNKVSGFVFSLRDERLPSMEMRYTIDETGTIQNCFVRQANLTIEKTDKKTAIASSYGLDNWSLSIPLDITLKNAGRLKTLLLKIETSNTEYLNLFIDDERQKIEKSKDGVFLRIQSLPFDDKDAAILPLPPDKSTAPFLEPGEFIQSNDAGIRELATTIAGDEKNSWVIANKIYEWLRENIKYSLSYGYASAKEVLKTRQGDCSEFAVLFAALSRSLGIPTKVCSGLAYWDWNDKLTGHAWNEVYVGKWVAIDAALRQVHVDATHIKLSDDQLDKDLGRKILFLGIFGQLRFQVVESEFMDE